MADLTMREADNPPPIKCNSREEFRAALQNEVDARSTLQAEFTIEKETPEYIFIIDTGHTRTKTVTNDAENVIACLAKENALGNRRVFYKDSSGDIDELLHNAGEFTGYKHGHTGIEL
jgi:hypothetical protein